MKICFVSNFMNHHQKPLADELYKRIGKDFLWIATTPVDDSRIKLGYEDLNESEPYILRTYKVDEYQKAYDACINCDCLIVAYEFGDIIKQRMKLNRMTVFCSERICKKSVFEILNPKVYLSTLIHFSRYNNKRFYFLSIGKYAAKDFSLAFAFTRKKYRWGYFVEVPNATKLSEDKWKDDEPRVFWASRFIDWKHPEYMILAAEKMKNEGLKFSIEMAGCGELLDYINEQIVKKGLSDVVKLCGPMQHGVIREKMSQSHIFCLTSNRREGWGAVVGEALSSNCVVIASKECGSSSFLINNKVNGLLFNDNDFEDFYMNLKEAILNFKKYKEMAFLGRQTMENIWNPCTASDRLIELIKTILSNKKSPFIDGPCSLI